MCLVIIPPFHHLHHHPQPSARRDEPPRLQPGQAGKRSPQPHRARILPAQPSPTARVANPQHVCHTCDTWQSREGACR